MKEVKAVQHYNRNLVELENRNHEIKCLELMLVVYKRRIDRLTDDINECLARIKTLEGAIKNDES